MEARPASGRSDLGAGSGGSGGAGGDGAAVTVDNTVGIATGQAEGALGIFAQSVGGNGGQGGSSSGGTFDGRQSRQRGGDLVVQVIALLLLIPERSATPNSIGIFAQSLGGDGAGGGGSSGLINSRWR